MAVNAEMRRPQPVTSAEADEKLPGPPVPPANRQESESPGNDEILLRLRQAIEEQTRLKQELLELSDMSEDTDQKRSEMHGLVSEDAPLHQVPLTRTGREKIETDLLMMLDYLHMGPIGKKEADLFASYLEKVLWIREIEDTQIRRLQNRSKLVERAVSARKSALQALLDDDPS
jgi:hypothetical protein